MAFVRPYPRCGKARDTFSGLDTDARVPSLQAEGYSIRHRRRIPHSPADPDELTVRCLENPKARFGCMTGTPG